MANKITKTKKFDMIIEVLKVADIAENDRAMLIEAMQHEQTLIANKSKGSKKANAQNEEIKNIVLEALATVGTPTTISDLMQESEAIKNYIVSPATDTDKEKRLTNQKITAIMKQLELENKVVNTKEKKKSYFALVEVA